VVVVLPLLAADDNKDSKKDGEKPEPKLVWSGEFTGRLVRLDINNGILAVQHEVPKAKTPVRKGVRGPSAEQTALKQEIARLRKDVQAKRYAYLRAVGKDKEKANEALQESIAKLEAVTSPEKPAGSGPQAAAPKGPIDLRVGDHMLVRVQQPPPAFDEKGNFKTYTQKELDELRGPDKRLPGFTGQLGALRQGQMVKVYLAPRTAAPATKDKAKEKDKSKDDEKGDKDKSKEKDDSAVPRVVMIWILDKVE
jgi:hypothetical protein